MRTEATERGWGFQCTDHFVKTRVTACLHFAKLCRLHCVIAFLGHRCLVGAGFKEETDHLAVADGGSPDERRDPLFISLVD